MLIIPTTAEDSVLRVVSNRTVHVEWDIHRFFYRTFQNGSFYFESPAFVFSDVTWFIRFYPEHNTEVFLDLRKKTSTKDLTVSVEIGIKRGKESAFKSCHSRRLFDKGECSWRVYKSPRSELFLCPDLLANNGVLTVFITLWTHDGSSEDITVEAASQTPSKGLETLSQNFKELFLDGAQSDITFKVQGKEFLAHKSVLAARSTVFNTMLKTDMVEKKDGIVDISDSHPDNFHDFLLHVYSGELDVVSPNNALELYRLADKYNLQELKNACCGCLIRNISVDSFYDVALLASLYNETKLMETVKEFFNKNASDIFPTSEWTSFLAEHKTLANELLIQMANKFKKYC